MRPTTLLAALALFLAACQAQGTADSGRPTVVASTAVIADLTRAVGGEDTDVQSLLPPGAEPHTFEPSPSDVRKVTEARIVFVNGLGLEGAAMKAIEANIPAGTPLVVLAEEVLEAGADSPPLRQERGGDPHLWLDPTLTARYIDRIAEALSALDPASAPAYSQRARQFQQALQQVDASVQEKIDSIPPANRKLVTTHGAFGYFADHYGLELVGFVAPSPSQEPSPRDIARLIEAVRDEGVPALFTEPGFKAAVLEQIAAEAGVRVCTLYSGAFDETARTYLDMMRFNADELVRCLGGDAGD